MPSPGSAAPVLSDVASGAELLRDARGREASGSMADAIVRYEAAIAAAERAGDELVLSEALRRVAIARRHEGNVARARQDCGRSYALARALGHDLLAAEALNTLGGLDLSAGVLEGAREAFVRALELGGGHRPLRARVEQNLGILANIQGQLDEALARYTSSLEAYRACDDRQGCAIAYNNLGMVCADRGWLGEAEHYFERCYDLAVRVRDRYLQALCLVNQAEVDVARQRFENGRRRAEDALALCDELGIVHDTSDAYRVLGVIDRETGRPALGESRLRTAIELAERAGSLLAEAEASRELALLCQGTGRNEEALRLLHAAYRLFRRLDARIELVHVGSRRVALEAAYLAVVREWGRSIELRDRGTFGHSERVARHAVEVARVLRLDEQDETTIMLGAYLHDVGKTRVPREILLKQGRLTDQELAVMRRHPVYGIELLHDVEFPWALKPIIRWHHERYDGTGYPDGLTGDAIPLSAQIVGIADYYDALTTRDGPQGRLTPAAARTQIMQSRGSWSDQVVHAFLRT
jgi:putative nucleotidyltransferase with HDIG domain